MQNTNIFLQISLLSHLTFLFNIPYLPNHALNYSSPHLLVPPHSTLTPHNALEIM